MKEQKITATAWFTYNYWVYTLVIVLGLPMFLFGLSEELDNFNIFLVGLPLSLTLSFTLFKFYIVKDYKKLIKTNVIKPFENSFLHKLFTI
jgi:hypothetical protein